MKQHKTWVCHCESMGWETFNGTKLVCSSFKFNIQNAKTGILFTAVRYISEIQVFLLGCVTERLMHRSLHYLCLNINNVNSYRHLASHNAFTEAKNHKHIYTLINIIKNMVQQ